MRKVEFVIEPTKKVVTIVAPMRAKRPNTHVKGTAKRACPFDAGNESLTPTSTLEMTTYCKQPNWQVRAMENKFPFLSQQEKFEKNKAATGAFGVHEVIVETPKHSEAFEDLNAEQTAAVFAAYANRFAKISAVKGVEYVFLFKNHGKLGGASIDHEHSQIVGLPFIPEIPMAEFTANKKSKCTYCTIAKRNVVFQNAEFAVVRPAFARFGLECWVIPKKHVANFVDFGEKTAALFMEALQQTVKKVKRQTENYNVVFHASCKKKKVHFHVEIYPHTATWAGLELGTGVIVNQMDEKTALKVLRSNEPKY